MNLRGKRDLGLTRIASGPSRFALRQAEGPLQVIRLDTGLVILELPPGRQETVVALAPGDYLVRRRSEKGVFAREVQLPAGGWVELREEELQLVGRSELAAKGGAAGHDATSLSAGAWELRLAIGRVYTNTDLLFSDPGEAQGQTGLLGSLGVGLTDRLSLSISRPGLAYRWGEAGGWEALAAAGLGIGGFGSSSVEGAMGSVLPTLSLDVRRWFGSRQSVLAGAGLQSAVSWARDESAWFSAWRAEAQAGYTFSLGDAVTLAPGAKVLQRFGYDDRLLAATQPGVSLLFGSALNLGDRALPLIQVHVHENLSLDGYASIGWGLPSGALEEQYLGGVTWAF